MDKIVYLSLEQKAGSNTLDMKLTPLVEQLGVLDKAYEVMDKYEPMLRKLANELLDVIKNAAEKKEEELNNVG